MNEELNTNTPETEESYNGILGDYQETVAPQVTMEEAKKPEPKKSGKKGAAVAGICAAVLALGGLGAFGIIKYRQTMPKTAASSTHGKITDRMAACYLQDAVDMYKSYYGEEALKAYFNLDLNLSLKSQEVQGEEGVTWFDDLIGKVENNTQQYLVLKEAGVAMGHKISDSDYEIIEDRLNEADYSIYGNNVTERDLRQALELQAYSAGVYRDVYEGFTFTDEELGNYVETNGSSYITCGLMGFSISYTMDENATEPSTEEGEEEDGAQEITKKTADKLADELLKCKSPDAFGKKVQEILVKYEGYSKADAEETVQTMVTNDQVPNSGSNMLTDWAFSGTTKVGDLKKFDEGTGAIYVYLMIREPSRDESPTIGVRHILFSTNDHLAVEETDATDEDRNAALEECRNLANQTLEEWKSGEASEDSFAALASEKTEDPGSKENGGLYSNVTQGQMVQPFNDWCFDESRKPGDTGIVETSYGVHVMYFVGESDPMWKVDATSRMRAEKYEEWYKEQENTYTVTINDEIFKGIDG